MKCHINFFKRLHYIMNLMKLILMLLWHNWIAFLFAKQNGIAQHIQTLRGLLGSDIVFI